MAISGSEVHRGVCSESNTAARSLLLPLCAICRVCAAPHPPWSYGSQLQRSALAHRSQRRSGAPAIVSVGTRELAINQQGRVNFIAKGVRGLPKFAACGKQWLTVEVSEAIQIERAAIQVG